MIHRSLRNPCLANSSSRTALCPVRTSTCNLRQSRPPLTRVASSYYDAGRSMSRDDVGGYSDRQPKATEPDEVVTLRKSLFALENERDDVLRIGEGCAKAAVQLSEEISKWNDLAVARLQRNDEEGARSALRAKAAAAENMDKNTARAQANFALAAKIVEKIGVMQSRLVSLGAMAPSTPKPAVNPPPPASNSSKFAYPSVPKYEPISSSGSSTPTTTSGSSSSSAKPGSPLSPEYQVQPPKWQASLEDARQRLRETGQDAPKWQVSLDEAQRRVREAAEAAEGVGRSARLDAEDRITEAQERLRGQPRDGFGRETLWEQRERIRLASEASITEAQGRLRGQDAEILGYARRVVDRYRRGEYVSEEQLEFAFRQLERLTYL